MIEKVKVDEEQCLELIAADLEKNGGIVQYPSTLGQDCDSKTKFQLTLFLVCKYT